VSDLDDLRRWEDFGGAWAVVARRGDVRIVALLRCDGGEEVSRITSDDTELRSYVDAQR
jgi:hypothetical protein